MPGIMPLSAAGRNSGRQGAGGFSLFALPQLNAFLICSWTPLPSGLYRGGCQAQCAIHVVNPPLAWPIGRIDETQVHVACARAALRFTLVEAKRRKTPHSPPPPPPPPSPLSPERRRKGERFTTTKARRAQERRRRCNAAHTNKCGFGFPRGGARGHTRGNPKNDEGRRRRGNKKGALEQQKNRLGDAAMDMRGVGGCRGGGGRGAAQKTRPLKRGFGEYNGGGAIGGGGGGGGRDGYKMARGVRRWRAAESRQSARGRGNAACNGRGKQIQPTKQEEEERERGAGGLLRPGAAAEEGRGVDGWGGGLGRV